jgi:hypothetical protein
MKTPNAVFSTALLTAAVLLVAPARSAPPEGSPVSFDAVAINMSTVGKPGVTRLHITIERWSSEEDRDRLRDALIEKGPEALMAALQTIKPRAGFISSGTSLGWNIQYAREYPLVSGGQRVVFATDRPMSFQERIAGARSAEYDFMLAELRIGADGKGEGKLVPRAKVTYNKDARSIEIENYANEPVRLGEVRVTKP